MTVVVSDSFTRANSTTTLGTPTVGPAWQVYTGTWGINTSQGYCATGVASNYAFAVVDSSVGDGTIECTFPVEGTGADTYGLYVRSTNQSNGFFFAESNAYRRLAGVETSAGAYTRSFVAGDRMRVVLVGSSLEVFRQVGATGPWQSVLAFTDSNMATNTKHGLAVFGTGATNARFDDFSVDNVPVTNYSFDSKVEIAFDSGYSTPVGSRTWTDVSQWVELERGISISHGRQDEFGVAEANRLALTLDNSDGRFTAEKTDGAYYPNVKIGRPIRVTSVWAGVDYTRFVGYVDEWPVAWEGGTSHAEAQITASSRIARLGFDSELRSTITEEYLSIEGALPSHYWPMQEPSEATAAADLMGGPSLIFRGWGDTPDFGTAMGLPGDSSATGVFFDDSGSQELRTTLATPLSAAFPNVISIEGYVAGATNNHPFLALKAADPPGDFFAIVAQDDVYTCAYYDGTNVVQTEAAADGTFPHHLAASLELSATGTATVSLWIDGVLEDSVAQPGMTSSAPFEYFKMDEDGVFQSTIAHVALNADMTRVAERAAAGITGFDTDTAEDRILRYAGYASIDPAEVDSDTGLSLIGPIDTGNAGVLEAMRRVEATENGVLFDARDNTLTFHGRERRYHTSSVFTLDAALQQVESDLAPKLDRSTLANDVTASTSADGSSARAFDQASIDEYGNARATIEVAGNQDAGYQAATWRVLNYSQPLPRIDSLGVNLMPLSTTLRASLLNADVSTRFTLAGLPAQAPAASVDFFIEGYVETIGLAEYELAFNVSPVSDELNNSVWILQDATYGVYDANPLAF